MRNLIALTLVVISIGTSAHAGNIFLENNKALRGLTHAVISNQTSYELFNL